MGQADESRYLAEQRGLLEKAEQFEHDHDNDDDSNYVKNVSIHAATDTRSGMHGQWLAKLTSDHATFTLGERCA